MQSIEEILYLHEDDVVEMKKGGRIGFDNGGEVEKLADDFVKQEKLLGKSVDDQLRKEYIDALKKQTSPVQTSTFKYPFKVVCDVVNM